MCAQSLNSAIQLLNSKIGRCGKAREDLPLGLGTFIMVNLNLLQSGNSHMCFVKHYLGKKIDFLSYIKFFLPQQQKITARRGWAYSQTSSEFGADTYKKGVLKGTVGCTICNSKHCIAHTDKGPLGTLLFIVSGLANKIKLAPLNNPTTNSKTRMCIIFN